MPDRRIDTEADLAAGLDALLGIDPDLRPLSEAAGKLPLRRRPGGFAGLAWIVVGQQVSTAAAAAIWGRLERAVGVSAAAIAAASDEALRAAGLSNAKVRTLRALAGAVAEGFDLEALTDLDAPTARRRLTALHGIGPWTADLYLLACLGHADVFPAGDLALRIALADQFGLVVRPTIAEAEALGARWAPWRAVAARLLWAGYRLSRAGGRAPA